MCCVKGGLKAIPSHLPVDFKMYKKQIVHVVKILQNYVSKNNNKKKNI